MQLVKGAENFPESERGNVFLALGNFDGVHLGHQRVIANAVQTAKSMSLRSAALIFNPHPAKIINPRGNLMLLSDMDMKADLFAALGLDYFVIEPFNLNVSSLSTDDFFQDYLIDIFSIKGLATGFDYSFGKNAGGGTELLKRWGEKYSFKTVIESPVKLNDSLISSSMIRKMISEGKVEEASAFLNYYFYRKGIVVSGDGRGKELGYPTANLAVPPELILPGSGVYFTAVALEGNLAFGATNIGMRPTFAKDEKTVEVHVLDYSGDLYGKEITVYFLKKIREEVAFNGASQLIEQLKNDTDYCRELIEKYSGIFKTGYLSNI